MKHMIRDWMNCLCAGGKDPLCLFVTREKAMEFMELLLSMVENPPHAYKRLSFPFLK